MDKTMIILSLSSVAVIIFFVLIQFTMSQVSNLFLILGLAVLAVLFSFWLYLLFKNVNNWKIGCIKLPSSAFFEFGLLFLMFATLAVPPNLEPIFPWQGIPLLLYFRGFIWLLGLSLLPGMYLLRFMGVNKFLSSSTIFVLGVCLSFVFVGLASLLVYSAQADFQYLPWFILVFLGILSSLFWLKNITKLLSVRVIKLSVWNIVLVLCLVTSIFIAFAVQVAQQYLIPGDLWVSLNPAVAVLAGRNVYIAFRSFEYPLMFGFVLAGLSTCSGLPVVNTYVILFPLISLNVLSFYALMQVLFNKSERIAVTATIIYSFMGGFGWIIQKFVYQGEVSFWSLSYLTQDIYFSMMFWNHIEFSYKSLSLSLVFAFMIAFVISSKIQSVHRKILMLSFSSLFMVFSFYIHMIDATLAPVVIVIAYAYEKGKWRYLSLILLLSISFTIIYTTNTLMFNYYTWLTGIKASSSINAILAGAGLPVNLLLPLLFFSPIIVFLGYLGTCYNWKRLVRFSNYKIVINSAKYILIAALIVVYIFGLYVWLNTLPSSYILYATNRLPWYYYTTRYGFVGFLALVGLGFAKWEEKWFGVAAFWCLFTFLVGNLWWGARTIDYIFPMLALFAAIGINSIFSNTNTFLRITITSINLNHFKKALKRNIRPVAALSIAVMTLLATSSVIYGASYYSVHGNYPFFMKDNYAMVFVWIHDNVPEDATVLVPNIYVINRGVRTISDRNTCLSSQLPTATDAISFSNAVKTLNAYNIRYAITIGGEVESPFLKCLLQYSNLAFQWGDIRVYRLPVLSPPSPSEYTVAVVNNVLLGFMGNSSYVGWLDDTFESGWFYKNVNATSDGEVLTFKKQFLSIEGFTNEPSAKRYIDPVIDTNVYPYLVIRYRNTEDTNISVGQIVTLINEAGYPEGFIKNYYLSISNQSTFQTFTVRLPENQRIAEICIWMRNWVLLNGTAGLQIDYIAFTSNTSLFEVDFGSLMYFLCVTTPALWPTRYAVFSSFNQTANSSSVVSTYNKGIVDYLQTVTGNVTFVFFNTTATIPLWGENWQNVEIGFLGSYNENQILIIDTKSITQSNQSIEGLSMLASKIYQIIHK